MICFRYKCKCKRIFEIKLNYALCLIFIFIVILEIILFYHDIVSFSITYLSTFIQ